VYEGPLPVMVKVYVPASERRDTVSLSVELPPDVTDAGVKLALTPEGRPEIDRLTVCAEPDNVEVITVVEIERPSATVPDDGLAAREKVPGTTGAVTVSEKVAVWVPDVAVPVTVTA